MNAVINDGIKFAMAQHGGQHDKGGQPYILHPLRVMTTLAHRFPEDQAIQVAGVLHDVVEDCGPYLAAEIQDRFGTEVWEIVLSVTRDKAGGEQYKSYIYRAKGHPKGREVKRADIEDNLQPWRLALIPDRDLREFLRRRYVHALTWLLNE